MKPVVLPLCFALLGAAACSTKVQSPDGGASSDPLVISLSLTATPTTDIVRLQGHATQIEVFLRTAANDPKTETINTVFSGLMPIDLALPRPNSAIPIAVLDVDPGFVTQVRIAVDQLTAVSSSGATTPIVLPGGALRIVMPQPLPVTAGAESDVLARLDVDQMLKGKCGQLTATVAQMTGIPAAPIDVASSVQSDRLNVYFRSTTTSATISAVVSGYDSRATIWRRMSSGLVSVQLPTDRLLSQAITYFESQSSVEFTSAAYRKVLFAQQGPPPNDSQGALVDYAYFQSAAYEAHRITLGDSRPVIAVIDSGSDLDNPDLALNIWINEKELPAAMRANGVVGAGADFDGDGIVTMRDLNVAGHESFLAGFGITKAQGDSSIVDARDLLSALTNGQDEDQNGFVDDLVGWNFVEGPTGGSNDPTPGDLSDGTGAAPNGDTHGRGVGGVAAAISDNGRGIPGVAPRARLVFLRVCSGSRNGSLCEPGRDEAALSYAAQIGADVVNFSLGVVAYKRSEALFDAVNRNEDTQFNCLKSGNALRDALSPTVFIQNQRANEKMWQKYQTAPWLAVIAAGNCGALLSQANRPFIFETGLGVPGVQNMIAVTGLSSIGSDVGSLYLPDRTKKQSIAGLNLGSDVVDIGAPGLDLPLVGAASALNGRTTGSGTSFAAPFVAGTAALLLSAVPSLRGHPDQVKSRILQFADKNAVVDSGSTAGTTFIRDGNRLNVCQTIAAGICPFPYFVPETVDAGFDSRGGTITDGPVSDIPIP